MKQLFVLILLFVSFEMMAIKASVDVLRFSNADIQYVEVNYRIFANSLNDKISTPTMEVNEVLSTIIVYRNKEIVDFQKNLLVGGQGSKDLLDVRRFQLEPGEYNIAVELQDQKGAKQKFKVEKRITINPKELISISDIMLLATATQSTFESPLVRNGVYMETMPYSYFDEEVSILKTYVEIYGLQQTEKYYCSYEIIKGYDTEPEEVALIKYKRLDAKAIQAYLLKLELSDLVSGNYHFAIKVYNSNKDLIASKTANFVRSNSSADIEQLSLRSEKFENSFAKNIDVDSLNYVLMAIAPLVFGPSKDLIEELINNDNEIAKRRYIHDYWKDRAQDNAEGAYLSYMTIARAVDRRFYNGTSYGFDTDLGYIFLRYGAPDDAMIVDDELSAFPYQIWRYEKIVATGENNVKFLFYAPSLSHRDFRLLHSTCRVELQTPSWEAELYRRLPEETVGNQGEARSVNDGFSRRARDLWEDF